MQKSPRVVGYALNCFPAETLAELWGFLENEVLQIKQRAFPDDSFPIELRFSERILRDLTCDEVSRLKYFLDTHDLALVTVNGFVMPHFHGERVKERVYLPAWHESDARLRFTNQCVDLLAQLAPADAEFVSVSVPFGALKPVSLAAIAPNILKAGEHARRQHAQTGVRCVIGLEPEPGLCVETTEEVCEFFEKFVPSDLRQYLMVNFDLSHQLVEFEELIESVDLLQDQGIEIAKIHVSNAASFTELKTFYDESIYLHQVCGIDSAGNKIFFSLDWPTTPPPTSVRCFRCHYHLPVYPIPESPVATTLDEVGDFLSTPPARLPEHVPFIIETYTWPEQLRGSDRMVENICRELAWVREKISLSRS